MNNMMFLGAFFAATFPNITLGFDIAGRNCTESLDLFS
jgi:hypothetical protein